MRRRNGWEWFLNAATVAALIAAIALSIYGVRSRRRVAATTPPMPETVRSWRDLAISGHRIGSVSAPVVITEFSDYLCPFCVAVQPTLERLIQKYDGQVAIAFHHWPQPTLHPLAVEAALAAECASEQGAFLRYHQLLFAQNGHVTTESWATLATQARVADARAFAACLRSGRHADYVSHDASIALALGARGTPFFLVNQRAISGAQPESVFVSLIEKALADR